MSIIYLFTILVDLLLLIFLGLFVLLPIAFMHSFKLQSYFIFRRRVTRKENFEPHGMPGTRNFYIEVTDVETKTTVTLGVWHILPLSLVEASLTDSDFDAALMECSHNVFIHFHGNGETRKDSKDVFNMLRMFCHVIAFDYRGYGDSSPAKMTEEAIIDDCKQLCGWVMQKTRADIYLWGRSLGASFAISTAVRMQAEEGISFDVVVLEAAFTNLNQILETRRFAKVFHWLPWYWRTIVKPLSDSGFRFDNLRNIEIVDCPILMFHAENDSIIPYRLGKKLLHAVMRHRRGSQGAVTFRKIPAIYGCDHFWICRYQDLPYDLRNFLIRNKGGNNVYLVRHGQEMILKHWVLGRKLNANKW